MGTIIGITICAFAIATLSCVLYKREQKNEELLRSMEYTREKNNK